MEQLTPFQLLIRQARSALLSAEDHETGREAIRLLAGELDEAGANVKRIAQLEEEARVVDDDATVWREERDYYRQSLGAALLQLAELEVEPNLAGIEVPESIETEAIAEDVPGSNGEHQPRNPGIRRVPPGGHRSKDSTQPD